MNRATNNNDTENKLNPAVHFLVTHEDGKKTRLSYDLLYQTKESITELSNAFAKLNEMDPSFTAWFTMGKLGNTDNEV